MHKMHFEMFSMKKNEGNIGLSSVRGYILCVVVVWGGRMETELCNMCMISDREGRVLVQNRLPKPTNPWSGLTFPGGHVEPGETVVASVIREVREETGLTVSDLRSCGYIQWYNPEKRGGCINSRHLQNSLTTVKFSKRQNVPHPQSQQTVSYALNIE